MAKNYFTSSLTKLPVIDKTYKKGYSESATLHKSLFDDDILARSAIDYLYSKNNRDKTQNFLKNSGLPSFEDREYNKKHYGEQEENKRILDLFKKKTNSILNPKLPGDTDRAFLSGFLGKKEEEENYKKKLSTSNRELSELQDAFRGSHFEGALKRQAQNFGSAPGVTNTINRGPDAKSGIQYSIADPKNIGNAVNFKKNKRIDLDALSDLLAVASLIPGVDTFTDLAAIPVDLARGDISSAALDLLGVIPVVGEIADTAKLAKVTDNAISVAKAGNKVADISRAAKQVSPSNLVQTHGLTLSKKQYDALVEDIRKNGITESIKYVVYKGRKYVVDGHHRLSVAKQLKLNKIPVQEVSLPYKGYKTIEDLLWFD